VVVIVAELEIAIAIVGMAFGLIAVIYSMTNRITRLESKMDIFLEWLICIDEDKGKETKQAAYKRAVLKKKAEATLNGDSSCSDYDCG